jgi:predicted O-methyltransferase YrrM
MLNVVISRESKTDTALDKDGLPLGYFSESDIQAYRSLMARVPDGGLALEIGVYAGRSLCSVAPLARARGIRIWAVDSWENGDQAMSLFLGHLRHFKVEDCVLPVRLSAERLAPFFPDRILDLVFIDGPHSYEYTKEDILAWMPKVKPGGWLAGHDYDITGGAWPGVKQAVHEIFGERSHSINVRDSSIWAHQM